MVSCDVYKSDRRALMYLYVLEGEGLRSAYRANENVW